MFEASAACTSVTYCQHKSVLFGCTRSNYKRQKRERGIGLFPHYRRVHGVASRSVHLLLHSGWRQFGRVRQGKCEVGEEVGLETPCAGVVTEVDMKHQEERVQGIHCPFQVQVGYGDWQAI